MDESHLSFDYQSFFPDFFIPTLLFAAKCFPFCVNLRERHGQLTFHCSIKRDSRWKTSWEERIYFCVSESFSFFLFQERP